MKESPGNEIECHGHVMRRALRRKEGDANGSTGEEEERKA